MEDLELRQKIDDLSARIEKVYVSVEKTRKYFLTIIVISVVAFVLPLIGLLFAIPQFLSTYSAIGGIQ